MSHGDHQHQHGHAQGHGHAHGQEIGHNQHGHDQHGQVHQTGHRGAAEGVNTDQRPEAFWEEFYGSGRRPWSGRPNRVLVEELAARPLPPGSVLDLGSGSGADAVWFAELGWTVTGADMSSAALAVAAEAAASAGVSDRVSWLCTDLEQDFPAGTWDLVVASYLHSPVAFARDRVLRWAAAAVAPGGTLLVLGHEGFPAWHDSPVTMPTVPEVLAAVGVTGADRDQDGWEVVRTETVAFPIESPDGVPGVRTDHVIRLRRS